MSNVVNLNNEMNFGLRESEAVFPVGTVPLKAHTAHHGEIEVPDSKAVVRRMGDRVVTLGVVGQDYKLLRHGAYFSALEDALSNCIDATKRNGYSVETHVSYRGAYAERRYIFPAFANEIVTNTGWSTRVGFQVYAWNGYTGNTSAGMACGLIDFFCKNGCISGQNIDIMKRRHTSGLTLHPFEDLLKKNINVMQESIAEMQEMAQKRLDMARAEKLLASNFSERRAEQLRLRLEREMAERGDNVFALHSALTYYASHNSDDFPVRNTGRDNAAYTLMGRRQEVTRIFKGTEFRNLMEEEAA